MSVNLMSAIFETEFFDLKDENGNVTKASTAKLVLLAMADHANDEGEGAYPSIERLCRKTALSPQTIRNTFDALRYNGIISLTGLSKHGTNNHTINTRSFPKAIGKEVTVLTLYPLEGSNQSPAPLQPVTSTPLTGRPESLLTINESPADMLSLENQIYAGIEHISKPDEEQAKRRDAANIISTGFGVNSKAAFDIAMAFQNERGLTFTESDIKPQRKAIKALLEKNIRPEHVKQAVKALARKNYSMTGLHSVLNTAVDIAIKKIDTAMPATRSMIPTLERDL